MFSNPSSSDVIGSKALESALQVSPLQFVLSSFTMAMDMAAIQARGSNVVQKTTEVSQ